MKKWTCALLAAALLLSAMTVLADEEDEDDFMPYEASVMAFGDREGVTLYDFPDWESDPLGVLYGGTPVWAGDHYTDDAGVVWAYVNPAYYNPDAPLVTGFVPAEDLMPFNRNYGAPGLFLTATVKEENAMLRREKSEGAQGWPVSGKVYVLGDFGDGWLLAVSPDAWYEAGLIRREALEALTLRVDAVFRPADGGDRATVYADKEMRDPIGYFYAGVGTDAVEVSVSEGWARVEGFKILNLDEDLTGGVTGYVASSDLAVFQQAWQAEEQIPTGILLETVEEPHVPMPAGSAVTVLGEFCGRLQAVVYDWNGGRACALDPAQVLITDRLADRRGPGRIGYAAWPSADPERENVDVAIYGQPDGETEDSFNGAMTEVLAEKDGWYQLRDYLWTFWVKSDGAEFISCADLIPARTEAADAGEWTADQESRGLWNLHIAPGQAAELTLTRPDGREEAYAVSAEGTAVDCAVYLAPGTRVRLNGEGDLRPMTGENDPVLIPGGKQDFAEDVPLFTGSGRYFCDTQISTAGLGIYGYYLTPEDPTKESWFRLSDLFDQGERTELRRPVEGEWDDDDLSWWESLNSFIDIYPGQFLEMHNCVLRVYYGNG